MVVRGFIAFLILNSLFSAGFGWLGYYSGIYVSGTSYYGWDAFWIIGGASFVGVTVLLLFSALMVALIDWVIN